MRNLKVIAGGSGTRGLMDFLIVKFASRAMRSELGYTDGRTKSLIRRYDPFTQRLRVQRETAMLKVASKVIKTTGEAVKDARAAAVASKLGNSLRLPRLCASGSPARFHLQAQAPPAGKTTRRRNAQSVRLPRTRPSTGAPSGSRRHQHIWLRDRSPITFSAAGSRKS